VNKLGGYDFAQNPAHTLSPHLQHIGKHAQAQQSKQGSFFTHFPKIATITTRQKNTTVQENRRKKT
jgi:hypothetical protein